MLSRMSTRRVEARSCAVVDEQAVAPPPSTTKDLQVALMSACLTQYWRKFEEMGYLRLRQVLKLGRGEKLNELIESLRPLPGHTVRLLNFVEEERARAQCAGAAAGAGTNGS